MLEEVPEAVGRRVREARAGRGLTLDQLAERSGVSRRMIVNVEAGTSNASIATLLRLATALRVSLADLVADAPAANASSSRGGRPGAAVARGGRRVGGARRLRGHPGHARTVGLDPRAGRGVRVRRASPGTHELLHVLNGQLTLTVGDEVHRLRAGDAASLVADVRTRTATRGAGPRASP